MARRIIRMASASSMLGLRRSPSEVGRRMQPKPSAEAFQSSFPKLRYCMSFPFYCGTELNPALKHFFRRTHIDDAAAAVNHREHFLCRIFFSPLGYLLRASAIGRKV